MERFGEAVKRLKGTMPVRELARRAHVDAGHLSRILKGDRPAPGAEVVRALDDALGANGELVRLTVCGAIWPLTQRWSDTDNERLADALENTTPTADNAVELAHEWLIAEAPQVYELRVGRRVGERMAGKVARRVQGLRLLDDYLGGEHTQAVVAAELAATGRLVREAAYTEAVGRRLLVAVGELCQLAGYVYTDAGRLAEAERLYLAGMRAAHAGGDDGVAANNLSALSYQLANDGDAPRAVRLARSAYAGARDEASATVRALLLERVAWAHALAGETGAAERALGAVDETYAERSRAADPVWAYWVTPEEVEIMRGRVWTELKRPLRAVPALRGVIEGYGPDRARETTLYRSWLAEALEQAGEVDEAAALATGTVKLSQHAHSVRAVQRIEVLRRVLAPHRGNAAVDEFEEAAATTSHSSA
ncbi:helix-turn-helix domain-containing protein [Catenuloplanes sp. NPDC051500]|uniref:helix-turn-helix domain-containing protein n=1 Tax=Catenuloplanes sp. NPDC051500 TaxID=3363959 RepID=UPI003794E98C